MLLHSPGGHLPVFRQEGIGHAVGKGAVWLVANFFEPDGEMRLQRVNHQPGAAVARIGHHLERPQMFPVHIAQQMFHVIIQGLLRNPGALSFSRGRQPLTGCQCFNILEAAVPGDGTGLLPDKLHTVVVGGIVTGGDHDTTVQLQEGRVKIYLLSAAETQVHHFRSGLHETRGEGIHQPLAAQPHVPSYGHPLGPEILGISPADAVSQPVIKLLRHSSPNVIGLKAGKMAHATWSSE